MDGKIFNIRTAPDGKTLIELELAKPTMQFMADLINWILRYGDPIPPDEKVPSGEIYPYTPAPTNPMEGTCAYACPNAPFQGAGDIWQPIITTTTGTLIINPTETNNINGENND